MRSHHSVCDGSSIMSLYLAIGDTYDTTSLLKIKDVPLW